MIERLFIYQQRAGNEKLVQKADDRLKHGADGWKLKRDTFGVPSSGQAHRVPTPSSFL
jgi:hypothetical protein